MSGEAERSTRELETSSGKGKRFQRSRVEDLNDPGPAECGRSSEFR